MMGFIEPEQAEQAPSPMMMEQEQAAAAESEAAPREGEVVPEGTAEAETGGIVLVEELERQGPALTNKTLRKWAARWCGGDREGLPHISTWNTSRVSDMSKLFENQRVFNDDIGTWDTSGVTSMEWMYGRLLVQSTDRQLAGRQGHEYELDVPRRQVVQPAAGRLAGRQCH